MKKLTAIFCVALLAACTQKADVAPVATVWPSPDVQPVSMPSIPAIPDHFYAIKDGNEYGYEKAISEEDRKKGQVAADVLMFNYLGEKDGAYQVMLKEGDQRTVAECTAPCEFTKIYTFSGTQFIQKKMMKLTPETILSSVLHDAMNGKLDVLSGMQQDRMVSFWVDGTNQKLTLIPVDLK